MTEIIRYSQLGKEDLRFGLDTFEVTLADGRKVLLTGIDIGALLNDVTRSTQTLTGKTLTAPLMTNPIVSSGPLTLTDGQIAFPATQNPSADAHTLDDYEEGTWTPSVGGNATYTQRTGTYTKKGNEITVHCLMYINVLGTGSTSLISGLPAIAAGGVNPTGAVVFTNLALSVVNVQARISDGGTSIFLNSLLAAGTSHGLNNILGNGSTIDTTITHQTA